MDAWAHTEAYEGKFKTEKSLQQALWLRIQAGAEDQLKPACCSAEPPP
jgi:hypothetical protein